MHCCPVRVGLAPSTGFERVKQLYANGIISDVYADVRPSAVGGGLDAIYFIGLNKHPRDWVESFQRDIEQIPEVRTIYLVAGQYGLLVHVAVRDTEHLRNMALGSFTLRVEVTSSETVLIFGHSRKHVLPNYMDPDASLNSG